MSFNSPSKGEKKIIDLLRANKIKFEREVSFDGLVGLKGVPLRFDFAIYRNNKLYCLIDFDGRQHFEFVKYFHKNICKKKIETAMQKPASYKRKKIYFNLFTGRKHLKPDTDS